jgi:hypothetical protein
MDEAPAMRPSRADCSIAQDLSRATFRQRDCADFVIEAAAKHQSPQRRQVQSLAVPVTQLPIQ